jgi:DNA-directed RNA polymerase specialized sigma24 family protein
MIVDDSRISAVVGRVVARKMGLFAFFPDLAADDLRQEGMIAARRAMVRYDPARGSWSTLVYRAASCRLIDIWRARSRHAAGDAAGASRAAPMPIDDGDLATWLRGISSAARRLAAPPSRRPGRPRGYSDPQAVAVAALMAREGLSIRGARDLLAARPELLVAAGLSILPSLRWLAVGPRRYRERWRRIMG